jgi:hypothetical protein
MAAATAGPINGFIAPGAAFCQPFFFVAKETPPVWPGPHPTAYLRQLVAYIRWISILNKVSNIFV